MGRSHGREVLCFKEVYTLWRMRLKSFLLLPPLPPRILARCVFRKYPGAAVEFPHPNTIILYLKRCIKCSHSNCCFFYYSGAFWEKFPHCNCWSLLLLRALGKISPQQLPAFLLLWCISGLPRTISKPQETFCTLKCSKTVLGHRLPPLFGSVARLGTNK